MAWRWLSIVALSTFLLLPAGSALAAETTSAGTASAGDARGRELVQQKLATLASNNPFVVRRDDSVEHLPDAGALEVFFRAALHPVTTDAHAQNAARARLRLAPEFRQDGFLQFTIPDDALKVAARANGGREVTGNACPSRA